MIRVSAAIQIAFLLHRTFAGIILDPYFTDIPQKAQAAPAPRASLRISLNTPLTPHAPIRSKVPTCASIIESFGGNAAGLATGCVGLILVDPIEDFAIGEVKVRPNNKVSFVIPLQKRTGSSMPLFDPLTSTKLYAEYGPRNPAF